MRKEGGIRRIKCANQHFTKYCQGEKGEKLKKKVTATEAKLLEGVRQYPEMNERMQNILGANRLGLDMRRRL